MWFCHSAVFKLTISSLFPAFKEMNWTDISSEALIFFANKISSVLRRITSRTCVNHIIFGIMQSWLVLLQLSWEMYGPEVLLFSFSLLYIHNLISITDAFVSKLHVLFCFLYQCLKCPWMSYILVAYWKCAMLTYQAYRCYKIWRFLFSRDPSCVYPSRAITASSCYSSSTFSITIRGSLRMALIEIMNCIELRRQDLTVVVFLEK